MNRITRCTVLGCAVFSLASCSSKYAQPMDKNAAYQAAAKDLSPRNFEDVGDTSLCTKDCSGHDAGFEWAKEKSLTVLADCEADDPGFAEGCEAYVSALQKRVSEYRKRK